MELKIERKGKKILLRELEFKAYMDKKLNDLTGLAANTVLALAMVSMIVLLTAFKANEYFYWALLLVPLVGRHYVSSMLNRWLKRKFKDLLGT